MNLLEFLDITEQRLPMANELIAVCAAIGIRFGIGTDGRPVLVHNDGNKEEGELLAKLVRREPWRSQVLALTGLNRQPVGSKREFLWRDGHRYTEDERDVEFGRGYPAGAWWFRHEGQTQWQAIPGRGGEQESPPLHEAWTANNRGESSSKP